MHELQEIKVRTSKDGTMDRSSTWKGLEHPIRMACAEVDNLRHIARVLDDPLPGLRCSQLWASTNMLRAWSAYRSVSSDPWTYAFGAHN